MDITLRDAFRIPGRKKGAVGALSAPAAPTFPKVTVSFVFDDGRSSQYALRAVFAAAGQNGTFYINSGYVGLDPAPDGVSRMPWSQIMDLAGDGNEIASHTAHHYVWADQVARWRDEIQQDFIAFRAHGLPAPLSFSYPNGITGPAAEQVVAEQQMPYAHLGSTYAYETMPPRIPLEIQLTTDGVLSEAAVSAAVTAAEQRDGRYWLVFIAHEGYSPYDSDLADSLAWLAGHGTPVKTVRRVYEDEGPPTAFARLYVDTTAAGETGNAATVVASVAVTADGQVIPTGTSASAALAFMVAADSAVDATGGPGYEAEVMADSPAHWWKLDEPAGASAVADSADARTGSASSVTFGVTSPAPPPGIAGPSSSWPASTTQNITFTGYRPTLAAASWEFWLNRNNVGQSGANPRIWGDGASPDGFDISLTDGQTLSLRVGNGTAEVTLDCSSTIDGSSIWHHIVFTYDGRYLRCYLDGALDCNPVEYTDLITPGGPTDDVRIGGNFPWQVAERFGGLLAQVALYEYALTAEQVASHWTAGTSAAGTRWSGTAYPQVRVTATADGAVVSGGAEVHGDVSAVIPTTARAAGVPTRPGSATVAAGASVSSSGSRVAPGSAAAVAQVVTAADATIGVRPVTGEASASAGAAVLAGGSVIAAPKTGQAALGVAAVTSAAGLPEHAGTALSAVAAVTNAAGHRLVEGAATVEVAAAAAAATSGALTAAAALGAHVVTSASGACDRPSSAQAVAAAQASAAAYRLAGGSTASLVSFAATAQGRRTKRTRP